MGKGFLGVICFCGVGSVVRLVRVVFIVGAVDVGVLVVIEKKVIVVLIFVVVYGIDVDLLVVIIVVLIFIYICEKRKKRGEEKLYVELEARCDWLVGNGSN